MNIVPAETELTAPYWAAARAGVVALQRCAGCGQMWHPPAPLCPRCRSTDYEWFGAEGSGRLQSYTRIEHAAHPAVAGALPYVVALVRLSEGPLFVCGLEPDGAELTDGLPVRIERGRAAGGLELPLARPERAPGGATGPARPA